MTETEFDKLKFGCMVKDVYDGEVYIVCGKIEGCRVPTFTKEEPAFLLQADLFSEDRGWQLAVLKKSECGEWDNYIQKACLN